jgi:hypothetical protein
MPKFRWPRLLSELSSSRSRSLNSVQLLVNPMANGYLCEDPTVHNLLSLNSGRSRNLLTSLADLTAGGISLILPPRFLIIDLFPLTISTKEIKDSSLDLSAYTTNFRCPSMFSKSLLLLSLSKLRALEKTLARTPYATFRHLQLSTTSTLCTPVAVVLRYLAQVRNPDTLLGLRTPCTTLVPNRTLRE